MNTYDLALKQMMRYTANYKRYRRLKALAIHALITY